MAKKISRLQAARATYQPKLPAMIRDGRFKVSFEAAPQVPEQQKIDALFPLLSGKPVARLVSGSSQMCSAPLTLGVVLSGGQAPGGHNVVAGLLDAVKAINPAGRLLGFIGGPIGIVNGNHMDLTPELLTEYRNTGGFDIIGSGRDKIEAADDLEACRRNLQQLGVSGLVVIGGDDSNTNAAVMAEYFLACDAGIQVIGVPKTIDGDMKNDLIETSFGFDSASKTYAEQVGNICRDSMSARKYWHFIRLMGRAASHITLEVALQTQPNLTVISEEVDAAGQTLSDVVDSIVDAICRRSQAGKNYGVLLVPEGLLEFLSDVKELIFELGCALQSDEERISRLSDASQRRQFISGRLSPSSAAVYGSMPQDIQEVLLRRDKHGNLTLSQIETEKLLIDLVSDRLRLKASQGEFKGSFAALSHFFGYEGRCVAPSNFDADYTYTLGYTAALLIQAGLTGYTVSAVNLAADVDQWVMGGVPVCSMLNMEMRKGKEKPVIKKALVDLEGKPFQAFKSRSQSWLLDDAYVFPGPIQYFGDSRVCDAVTATLELEYGS